MQTRRDLRAEDAQEDAGRVLDGPWLKALLEDQRDSGFGGHVYGKWSGAHWRLVSAVELGLPAGERRAITAYEAVLGWLLSDSHLKNVRLVNDRWRRCGSQEGNALVVGVRLGLASDLRVRRLAENLVAWQWPDGGWNCDKEPSASHSSFNETVTPLGALGLYAAATGDPNAAAAAHRAADFILRHEVYKSHTTGEVGNPKWLELRYPPYWRYDIVQGMLMLTRAGALPDPRATAAAVWLRGEQTEDGRWCLGGSPMWKAGGQMYRDPVGWERSGASQMLTLNALRALRAQGA